MIYLRNSTRKHQLNLRAVKRRAARLLVAAGQARSSLSLSLVGDAAMRRLNREHRRRDRPTDVLSFPLVEMREGRARAPAPAPETMLGDIVISLDAAQRQAAGYDATLEREVARLLIHGLAHLLGYDHAAPAQRRRMLAEERRLAAAIGLRWPYDSLRSRRE